MTSIKHSPLTTTDDDYAMVIVSRGLIDLKSSMLDAKGDIKIRSRGIGSSMMIKNCHFDADEVKKGVTQVLKVIGTMNLLGRIERLGLAEALKNKDAARPFLSALADVVEAPEAEEATFSALLDAVASFTVADPAPPVATWPVATILPFLARPDAHVLLKPTVSQKAAQGLSFDLKYNPSLNWETYERCILLASIYQQKLVELDDPNLAPRDLIDVQAFIWNTSSNWKKTAARGKARKKKKKVVVKEL